MLLQVLDDGRLTDGQGRTVDFRNTVLIMTSNIRSETELRDRFRPEFLNRIDEIVVFEELTREQIGEIVELQLARLRERLAERRIELELTDAAKEALADAGWDPAYGARPLKRAIQRLVENPLALRLLEGEFVDGDRVVVDASDGELTFAKAGAAAPAGSERPIAERAAHQAIIACVRQGGRPIIGVLTAGGHTSDRPVPRPCQCGRVDLDHGVHLRVPGGDDAEDDRSGAAARGRADNEEGRRRRRADAGGAR